MSILILKPRQAKFGTNKRIVIGAVEKKLLDILHKHKGRKPVLCKELSSTGQVRDAGFTNLAKKLWAKMVWNEDLGGNIYEITKLGEKVRTEAEVAKLPPSGYKKVIPITRGRLKRAA